MPSKGTDRGGRIFPTGSFRWVTAGNDDPNRAGMFESMETGSMVYLKLQAEVRESGKMGFKWIDVPFVSEPEKGE